MFNAIKKFKNLTKLNYLAKLMSFILNILLVIGRFQPRKMTLKLEAISATLIIITVKLLT